MTSYTRCVLIKQRIVFSLLILSTASIMCRSSCVKRRHIIVGVEERACLYRATGGKTRVRGGLYHAEVNVHITS